MSIGQFIKGAFVCLMPPMLAYALLFGWIVQRNAAASSGTDAQCSVSSIWLPPNETFIYSVTSDVEFGPQAQITEIPAFDIMFVLDASGSMNDYINELPRAVSLPTARLASRDDENRFGLALFASGYDVKMLGNGSEIWGAERRFLISEARKRSIVGGGTDTDAAAQAIRTLRAAKNTAASRPQRQTVVVLVSDFKFGNNFSDLERELSDVLAQGGSVYSIIANAGGAQSAEQSTAVRLAGDVSRVASLQDPSGLESVLNNLVVGGVAQSELYQVRVPIDARVFRFDTDHPYATGWSVSTNNVLQQSFVPVYKSTKFEAPLSPKRIGLWSVGLSPAEVLFANASGQTAQHLCLTRPAVLVAPLWLLLLPFLPLLLWLIAALASLFEKKKGTLSPIQYTRPKLAVRPRPIILPTFESENVEEVDTLLVALGAIPRDIAEKVKATQGPNGSMSVVVLEAPSEVISDGVTKAASSSESDLEVLCAKRDLARLKSQFDNISTGQTKAPEWLPMEEFITASANDIDIAAGGKNSRVLNRFFGRLWLENGLKDQLSAYAEAFLAKASEKGFGQFIVLADEGEPFSTALSTDISKLLVTLTNTAPIATQVHLLSVVNNGAARSQSAAFRSELATQAAVMDLKPHWDDPSAHYDLQSFDNVFFIDDSSGPHGHSGRIEQGVSTLQTFLLRGALTSALHARKIISGLPKDFYNLSTRSVRSVSLDVKDCAERLLVQNWISTYLLGGSQASSGGGWQVRNRNVDSLKRLFEHNNRVKEMEADQELLAALIQLETQFEGSGGASLSNLPGYFQKHGLTEDQLDLHAVDLLSDMLGTLLVEPVCASLSDITGLLKDLSSLLSVYGSTAAQSSGAGKDLEACFLRLKDHLDQSCERLEVLRDQALNRMVSIEAEIGNLISEDVDQRKKAYELVEKANLFMIAGATNDDLIKRRLGYSPVLDQDKIRLQFEAFLDEERIFDKFDGFVLFFERFAATLINALDDFRVLSSQELVRDGGIREAVAHLTSTKVGVGETIVVSPNPINGSEARVREKVIGDVAKTADPTSSLQLTDTPGNDPAAILHMTVSLAAASVKADVIDRTDFITFCDQYSERVRQELSRLYDFKLPVFGPRLRRVLFNEARMKAFAIDLSRGRVNKKTDSRGRDYWLLDGQRLTQNGGDLVSALMGYHMLPSDIIPKAEQNNKKAEGYKFSQLNAWMESSEKASDNAILEMILKAFLDDVL